jgi:spore coat polysaccharide biosynthesis protein SpsF (cytidylyltransferase family)
MSHKTFAFIQARMSSSRFPGKVLEPLQGVPMIVYMARRAARAQQLDGVVVVTSTDASDDVLAATLGRASVAVFRGDLNDVLKRYADAAMAHEADEIIRLTGDCPLIDPAVIDAVIDVRREAGADYASNTDPPTYPDGLDVECFSRAVLGRAHVSAKQASEREHVTLWMRGKSAGLRRANQQALLDMSALRLTVDYPDDLTLVQKLVARLPAEFDLHDILRVLSAEPDLCALNRHTRNEGLARSLSEDQGLAP